MILLLCHQDGELILDFNYKLLKTTTMIFNVDKIEKINFGLHDY